MPSNVFRCYLLSIALLGCTYLVDSFQPIQPASSRFLEVRNKRCHEKPLASNQLDLSWTRYSLKGYNLVNRARRTELYFMGSDGGILGVGTPEVFTILLVGYFVLGPSDLFKLVKELGKFVQNIRTMSTDFSSQIETTMESQLQIQEIRKAQAELNDAFSFRRSINVDPTAEAFSEKPSTYRDDSETMDGSASVAGATATATENMAAPRKKIRRRVKKREPVAQQPVAAAVEEPKGPVNENIPQELSMPAQATNTATSAPAVTAPTPQPQQYTAEELAEIDREFDQYTLGDIKSETTNKDLYSTESPMDAFTSSDAIAAPSATSKQGYLAAQARFQQQLAGNWNEQILANEDKLSPLATVMNKLALLEKEKRAATERLEEEFKKRADLEDEYYKEQRRLLEDAAQQVQESVLAGADSSTATSRTATASAQQSQNNTAVPL